MIFPLRLGFLKSEPFVANLLKLRQETIFQSCSCSVRHVGLITKMVGIVKSRRKICTELEDWRGRQEDERCNRRDRFPDTDEVTSKSFKSHLHYFYSFFYQETSLDQVSQVVLCEHFGRRRIRKEQI